MSANLLSRRTASPDLGRRAFGVWAFAAIGSPVALARAATLPTVASLRFGPHPPLEADGRGFVAGLAKSGFHVGENILLAQHDCQGSMANANTLAAELLRAQPAVLHVSATPSAQAVNSAHGVAPQVPVVFSSVTDPVGAGIVPAGIPAGQALGGNLTGVSSPWPVELQLQTYAQIAPRARRWGTLYNASESNSISHVRRLRQAATQLKLELVEITVRRPDDVAAAAAALAERADAILIVADNTADARLEAIAKVCNERRRPLFAGTPHSVVRGAAVSVGLDFYLVGYAAGRKAALVLKGLNAGDIPWEPMQQFSMDINPRAAAAQGLVLAPELLARADRVHL